MKEASLFLKAGDTPFLFNNALQGRAPSLSFYTQTVHQSGGEWLGHESEHESGHWHYLLKPELNHTWRGKGVREDPQPPKAKNHPQPAHAALPTKALLNSGVGCKTSANLSLQPVSPTLALPILSPFLHCWRLSISHNCNYQRILQPASPMQERFITFCRRLV